VANRQAAVPADHAERSRLGPDGVQRLAHVEHFSRRAPMDLVGSIDGADAQLLKSQYPLPGRRQPRCQYHSIDSKISSNSSFPICRGLPLMLLPLEPETISGNCSRVTPSSESRVGIPTSAAKSAMRAMKA